MRRIVILFILLFTTKAIYAIEWGERRYLVGGNLAEYLDLGGLNIELGTTLNRHWSIHLLGKYNPFWWNVGKKSFQHCEIYGKIEGKYWLWYVFSGWHLKGGVRYGEYNKGGLFRTDTQEGRGGGITLGGGYTLMVNKWWNIEFGLSLWGGYKSYKTYSAPRCGKLLEQGEKLFFSPENLTLSFQFTF